MSFLRVLLFALLTVASSAFAGIDDNPATAPTAGRPNIVLILVDDAALMDFGAYGGEADTPNIDQLAADGTLFTNFHASPMCAPSRAMLLTGLDSHLTGVPNLPLFLPAEIKNQPGYEGVLNGDVQTIAELLQQHDYDTFMTGKWHLGHTQKTLPSSRGFDRSFILDASGADNYEHRPYLPGQPKPPWFKDGVAVDLPDNFYSSRFLVDQMIEFIAERRLATPDVDRPFFSYIAFQAVHMPVQAPLEYTEKYIAVYAKGSDEIRAERIAKARSLGLFPETAPVGDLLPMFTPWDERSEESKKLAAKSMAVNAGMLDAMDHQIGRYVDYLKQIGEFDNTLFIVTSDNGPEASDPSLLPGMNEWLEAVGYRRDYDSLGAKGSFVFIGPEFATAAAGPGALFKFYAGEGGLRVPLILSGPGVPTSHKVHAFSFITDVVPTIMEIAGLPSVEGSGKSAVAAIRGETNQIYSADEGVGMEAGGQAAFFRGDFKLVRNNPPYGDGIWRLHNIAKDPGETQDLSATAPALFAAMRTGYDEYAAANGVIPMPEGYELVKQILLNNIASTEANTASLELAYSSIATDEVIEFFRTSAWLDEANGNWHIPIHGWIYEPEDSTMRKAFIAELLEKRFDLAPNDATKTKFSRRLNLLLADNERDKQIVVNIAGQQHTLSPSVENGHFKSTLIIATADIANHITDSHLSYSAITNNGAPRTFTGEVLFVEPNGLSVISDIDDTVKISHVTDRKKLLNHTFFLDFAAAPGMAQLYRDWADHGTNFHFVSSSPWQLYAPLREFLDDAGFPRATLNLKSVRFRDETLLDLFKKGTETKPQVIEEILDAYPDRQFVLVGDSGEQDPEVYAAVLKRNPDRILKVYIRNVSNESASSERFRNVFEGIDRDNWELFDDPLTLSLP